MVQSENKAEINANQKVDYKDSDKVVKYWFYAAMLWFPIFTSIGLILAIKFIVPTFLVDDAWLTFGRLRPAHVNGLLFGFLSSGLVGATYYVVPRLCNTSIYKPIIGKLNAVLWNAAVLVGVLMILRGDTQAREYAEMPWIIDVFVMITLILIGINVFGTIIKRKEKKLYAKPMVFSGNISLVSYSLFYWQRNVATPHWGTFWIN